ncbi:predicted protein [Chaetomium globosum CBS 148.51]|uniref:Uncharacterized protein n=1 Tax=Chaetomium globosum (strain ATCC 6205 / CBS 148.51 / DSM 1962 / NBRC 6347 / NRRL 1970) TaxID=306901 RepID=Q2HFN1_CHAGB|nr:uncharacterized protein CHGG_00973 [Chaetomium globosum CBS 148.51]EAQ92738.1 predicted protein [Chaetomium globosum CBS 148.51]
MEAKHKIQLSYNVHHELRLLELGKESEQDRRFWNPAKVTAHSLILSHRGPLNISQQSKPTTQPILPYSYQDLLNPMKVNFSMTGWHSHHSQAYSPCADADADVGVGAAVDAAERLHVAAHAAAALGHDAPWPPGEDHLS